MRFVRGSTRYCNRESEKTYYCPICNVQHNRASNIGKLHTKTNEIPPMSRESLEYALKHNVR